MVVLALHLGFGEARVSLNAAGTNVPHSIQIVSTVHERTGSGASLNQGGVRATSSMYMVPCRKIDAKLRRLVTSKPVVKVLEV